MALGVGGEVTYSEKTGERRTDSGVEDERPTRSLWPLCCLATVAVLGVSVDLGHGCCLNT